MLSVFPDRRALCAALCLARCACARRLPAFYRRAVIRDSELKCAILLTQTVTSSNSSGETAKREAE
jgi:hypothetical protein